MTHDLAVVAQIADHIVVLYNGKIKEAGPVDVIINEPQHPYTQKLMAAIKPLLRRVSVMLHLMSICARCRRLVTNIDAGYGGVLMASLRSWC